MNATQQYIKILTRLKSGEIGLLRRHTGQGLDETVEGFDLFAGLWWPLRQTSQRAPRREVAWLIAKLYACFPVAQSAGDTLARQLRRCRPKDDRQQKRFAQRFDRMLLLPLDEIEPALQWAIRTVAAVDRKLDWVKLTDDLSIWQRESTRLAWAEEFLQPDEREQPC